MTRRAIGINGAALRHIREAQGIRTDKLAADVGISYSYVANIESGHRRSVAPEIFKKFCLALRLDDPKAIACVPDMSAIDAEIERLVAEAPPLSESQKAHFARLFDAVYATPEMSEAH